MVVVSSQMAGIWPEECSVPEAQTGKVTHRKIVGTDDALRGVKRSNLYVPIVIVCINKSEHVPRQLRRIDSRPQCGLCTETNNLWRAELVMPAPTKQNAVQARPLLGRLELSHGH